MSRKEIKMKAKRLTLVALLLGSMMMASCGQNGDSQILSSYSSSEKESEDDYYPPAYLWSEDNSTCTAVRVSKSDEAKKESETVNATYEIVKPASRSKGLGRYTAKFVNPAFKTQYKDVDIAPCFHAEAKVDFKSMVIVDPSTDDFFDLSYTFSWYDDFFGQSGLVYNKELAIVSLGANLTLDNKANANAFYLTTGFEDLYLSPDYDKPLERDSLLYVLGHKKIGEEDVFSIGLNGFNYGPSWEANLLLGKEGNAIGFQSASDKLKEAFLSYFEEHRGDSNKVWITGYSRSASIANIFLEEALDEGALEEEKVYAYLFETPAVMAKENVREHPSIRNLINSHDAVTAVYPEEYGLIRAGVDLEIYDERIDEYASNFDPKIKLPAFSPQDGYYENEEELLSFFIKQLMSEKSDYMKEAYPDVYDLATRTNFVDGYQEHLSYLIGLFFTMNADVLPALKEKIAKMSMWEMLGLLDETKLYEFLSSTLDECGQSYDEIKLQGAVSCVLNYLKVVNAPLAAMLLNKEASASIARLIQYHAPEVTLPLLLQYGVNE